MKPVTFHILWERFGKRETVEYHFNVNNAFGLDFNGWRLQVIELGRRHGYTCIECPNPDGIQL